MQVILHIEAVIVVIPRNQFGDGFLVKGEISVEVVVIGLAVEFEITYGDFADLPFDFHHACFKETA